jgi:hypothetical protein
MGMLVKKAIMIDIQIKNANENARTIEEDNDE